MSYGWVENYTGLIFQGHGLTVILLVAAALGGALSAVGFVRFTQQRSARATEIELTRLSRVASETTNGVIITDTAGRIQWINEGFTRITGYALDEISGQKPGDILQGPKTDRATVETIRAALGRREGFEVDLVNYKRSGQPYWIRISCTPLRDPAGALQGFMAIESAISAQQQAEEESERKAALRHGLIQLSPIGIALHDYESGQFVDLNNALLASTGYVREDFIALSYWDVTPKEYESQEILQLEKMEKTGRYGPLRRSSYAGTAAAIRCCSMAWWCMNRRDESLSGRSLRMSPSASSLNNVCAIRRSIPRRFCTTCWMA